MKKTLMTCLAVVALIAIASTAGAITCTIDQRPAATLLVPYFQVSVAADDSIISTGPGARDTLVTIGNASSAPMIAHVSIYDRYSVLRLDFNIALTGYDIQAMRMSDVISGILPVTTDSDGHDTCQEYGSNTVGKGAAVYPDPEGFIRVKPLSPTSPQDNVLATTNYPVPAFGPGLGVIKNLADECGDRQLLATGYMVIDHANYCNLSDPTDSAYFFNDAIGNENNLWGEIIFTSGEGLPTYGISTVNLEADNTLLSAAGDYLNDDGPPVRTFYARYWEPNADDILCSNCAGGAERDLNLNAPWDYGYGDGREPLGLNWAVRWFDLTSSGILTTNFQVWRSSYTISGKDSWCKDGLEEPTVTLTFFDEDENTTTQGVCPSPCTQPTFNFPWETQQRNITSFSHPLNAAAGWVDMSFVNNNDGDILDQAWVGYAFEGSVALESVLIPGTQLDPSSCNPLGLSGLIDVVTPAIPTIPTGVGLH
jgi:hypothetical protein